MTTITLSKREVTYLLVALNQYREHLRASMGEESRDEFDDLLMADHLVKRITDAETQSELGG